MKQNHYSVNCIYQRNLNIVFCSCQTYEGGFCGVPGMEAHGGYAFCGLAALFMLQKQHLCDLQSLLVWFTFRILHIKKLHFKVFFYFLEGIISIH